MFRRALVATFAAAVVEQGTATWLWKGRTMSERTADGECVSNPADNLYFGTQYSDLWTQTGGANISTAKLMEIAYKDNFKVVTSHLAKEQYVLTQCGTTTPTAAEVDAFKPLATNYSRKYFIIPLEKVSVETSTTMLGFIDALGLEDRVVAVSQYSVAPCWQKARMTCSQLINTSNVSELKAQNAAADGVFVGCSTINATSGRCDNADKTPNGIDFTPTSEYGSLHGAEYLKIMAAFFNKEAQANNLFAATVTNFKKYTALSGFGPVVAWISYSTWNKEFIISLAPYKLEMVTAAGYANVDEVALKAALPALVEDMAYGRKFLLKEANYTDKAACSAALFAALSTVYAVVDEFYTPDPAAYSVTNFYTNYGLTASSTATFVTGKKILRIDGTMSSDKNLDWYESRVAKPDMAVEGLRHSVSGDASLRQYYFRNIAAGETPTVLTKMMCSKSMPGCDSNSKPKAIKHNMVAPQQETSGANAVSCFTVLVLSAMALLRV